MGKTLFNNQKGAILVLFCLLLTVLLGFCALGMEAGYWYLVRAELSKSVDAGAIAGAKNISNPHIDPLVLAEQVAQENFPVGTLGTPLLETGTVTFKAYLDPDHRIRVVGTVSPPLFLSTLFGVKKFITTSIGVARKNAVEIMLVLDRSGSMGPSHGNAIADLKTAAKSFIAFFEDTENQDKLGLISFATGVTVDFPLGTNYVFSMTQAINRMAATGATNAEDALAQAAGAKGLTDQSAIPSDKRVQQFVVFFSDGNPTALRGKFKHKGAGNIDAVVCGTGQSCDTLYNHLGEPDSETWLDIDPGYTGDGNEQGTSKCHSASTTKWHVFSRYPVSGYSDPEHCYIPHGRRQTLPLYVCDTARQMAMDKADALKNNDVKIYTIGLGQIDPSFLSKLASGSSYEYYTPDSKDLQAIFNAIAKDIKLRLVQ